MRWIALISCAACFDSEPTAMVDAAPPDAPAGCTSTESLAEVRLTISGVVRDFATSTPIAGASVDIARAWTPLGFPRSDCPYLASFVTDVNGVFGPVEIAAGPRPGFISNGQFIVVLAHGAGIASTSSDARFSCSTACTLAPHVIAAPATDLALRWRADLAASGMPDAATRGLVAFAFEDADDKPAQNVEALAGGPFSAVPLVMGTQLRYVADDGELAPVTSTRTGARGVAVIGVTPDLDASTYVAGRRGAQTWTATGSIVAPGWIFVEDRNVSPM